MKKLYHFLGGVYFAVFLIATLAITVAVATFIEGSNDSHDIAVDLVYNTQFFNLLLVGFFINIFLSALRRWPFKWKHAPFILTHIGLLMIISGTMIKNVYGIQGMMTLVEGTSSHTLTLSKTKGIYLDDGEKKSAFKVGDFEFNGFKFNLKGYIPHAKFQYTSWIKLDGIDILGFPKIQKETSIPLFNEIYEVKHVLTDHLLEKAKELYLENLTLPQEYILHWSEEPTIEINSSKIPLTGFFRHIDPKFFGPYTGERPLTLQLQNKNQLLFISNDQEILILLIRKDGSLHLQKVKNDKLSSYYAYGKGFGGYSLESRFPEDLFLSLKERLELLFTHLDREKDSMLPFFWKWQELGTWLFEETDESVASLPYLENFKTLGEWSSLLMPHIEKELLEGKNPLEQLEEFGWKTPEGYKKDLSLFEKLSLIQHQLYSLAPALPPLSQPVKKETIASALYRSLGISFDSIFLNYTPMELSYKTLETNLGFQISTTSDLKSPPAIAFECRGEKFRLIFDKFHEYLKWPILNGKFLASFEPLTLDIPYKVRLKQARKVCHLATNSPSVYEADVIFTDLKSGISTPFTLMMNQVYQSKDGYRFYLTSMTDNPKDAKQIVLVINHDPVRYILTYPGGILVALGAILLFTIRRKKT